MYAADTVREKPFHPSRGDREERRGGVLIVSVVRQERRIITIGEVRTTRPARRQLNRPAAKLVDTLTESRGSRAGFRTKTAVYGAPTRYAILG